VRSFQSRAVGGSSERFESDALYGLNERPPRSVRVPDITVCGENRLDNVGYFQRGEGRPDYLSRLCSAAQGPSARSAECDLIPLLTVLVDAENADVTAVVMAA
jgi:hypothetical protein